MAIASVTEDSTCADSEEGAMEYSWTKVIFMLFATALVWETSRAIMRWCISRVWRALGETPDEQPSVEDEPPAQVAVPAPERTPYEDCVTFEQFTESEHFELLRTSKTVYHDNDEVSVTVVFRRLRFGDTITFVRLRKSGIYHLPDCAYVRDKYVLETQVKDDAGSLKAMLCCLCKRCKVQHIDMFMFLGQESER